MTNTTDPTAVFPGDATPGEIRTAVAVLELFARHDGPDDWARVAQLAQWVAEAANWQIRDAKAAPGVADSAGKPWLAECYDDTHGGTR